MQTLIKLSIAQMQKLNFLLSDVYNSSSLKQLHQILRSCMYMVHIKVSVNGGAMCKIGRKGG